jgi:hypothetical protein
MDDGALADDSLAFENLERRPGPERRHGFPVPDPERAHPDRSWGYRLGWKLQIKPEDL